MTPPENEATIPPLADVEALVRGAQKHLRPPARTPATSHHEASTALEAAQAAVSELEAVDVAQLPPGAIEAAERAVAAVRDPADAELFPAAIRPVPGDAVTAFGFYSSRFQRQTFGAELANLHAASVDSFPALAALLRGHVVIGSLADLVFKWAPTGDGAAAQARELAVKQAVSRYKVEIARQLADRGDHAAQRYLAACALADRVAAVRQQYEAHAAEQRAAAARVAAEAAAAAKAAEQRAMMPAFSGGVPTFARVTTWTDRD